MRAWGTPRVVVRANAANAAALLGDAMARARTMAVNSHAGSRMRQQARPVSARRYLPHPCFQARCAHNISPLLNP
jgi:hypothetical protein